MTGPSGVDLVINADTAARMQQWTTEAVPVPEVQLIARHTIAAGKVGEVLPLLPRLAQAALTEPGCLAFEVFSCLDDEHSYVLPQRCASRAALDSHRQNAHFKDLVLGQIVPRLSSRVLEAFDAIE
jgi:quinol monooxygenase YgiN